MSNRELVVLGTASQAPTRHRAHNAFALRWDDQLLLFDPGEGTQRQCLLARTPIARVTAVCITHFHGDHCLGLPGVIQRRSLDANAKQGGLPPLPIFFPGDGAPFYERMRSASIFHDASRAVANPISSPGVVGTLGNLTVSAEPLEHRVTTFGYRLDEPDGRTVLPDRLDTLGLGGPDIGRLVADGNIATAAGDVMLEDVSVPRRGQSMAFIMDTVPCEGARRLAEGVDLLVCEATYLHSEVELAERYRHMTATQAATLAVEAGARRLVLGHFSARYDDMDAFAEEAGAIHPDVVIAEDLAVVAVPPRTAT